MKALRSRLVIITTLSLAVLAAAGCRTSASVSHHQTPVRAVAPESSPFLERGGYPDRLLAMQEVLNKHRFSKPWVAVRGQNSSIWFVAERSESAQRFERLYVEVRAEGPVTASITPYDFVLSGWAMLGKLFVDFDPEARTIAAEIMEKLRDEKRAAR